VLGRSRNACEREGRVVSPSSSSRSSLLVDDLSYSILLYTNRCNQSNSSHFTQ
jgi:hypothetical protein